MIVSVIRPSPLGPVRIAGSPEGLAEMRFLAHAKTGSAIPAILAPACRWLEAYFAGEKPDPGLLDLAPVGTSFQHLVWNAMQAVPYGQTTTYGELAKKLGTSPRAIGGAAAANPLFIVVPCHRVIGANGQPKGYAGGIAHKIWLLDHEGCAYSPPTTKARG